MACEGRRGSVVRIVLPSPNRKIAYPLSPNLAGLCQHQERKRETAPRWNISEWDSDLATHQLMRAWQKGGVVRVVCVVWKQQHNDNSAGHNFCISCCPRSRLSKGMYIESPRERGTMT